jgi:hypothetical protein
MAIKSPMVRITSIRKSEPTKALAICFGQKGVAGKYL